MKEHLIPVALHYDIDVPCPLERALFWFSAPTKPQPQVREQWNKSGQIQVRSQQCN